MPERRQRDVRRSLLRGPKLPQHLPAPPRRQPRPARSVQGRAAALATTHQVRTKAADAVGRSGGGGGGGSTAGICSLKWGTARSACRTRYSPGARPPSAAAGARARGRMGGRGADHGALAERGRCPGGT